MSQARGRFEIVRTNAEQPWHARFVAPNGRILFSSEQYARRAGALNAISSLLRMHFAWVEGGAVVSLASRDSWKKTNRGIAEVREVDER